MAKKYRVKQYVRIHSYTFKKFSIETVLERREFHPFCWWNWVKIEHDNVFVKENELDKIKAEEFDKMMDFSEIVKKMNEKIEG